MFCRPSYRWHWWMLSSNPLALLQSHRISGRSPSIPGQRLLQFPLGLESGCYLVLVLLTVSVKMVSSPHDENHFQVHNTTWWLELKILLEMKGITFSKRASSLCCKFWAYYTKEYSLIFELSSQFFPSWDFRPTLVSGSLRMRIIAYGSMYFVLGYQV